MTILEHDPAWRGVLAYSEFERRPVLLRQPPQIDKVERPAGTGWTDLDATRAAAWLEHAWGLTVASKTVYEAATAVAARTPHHPVRAYLDAVTWDGAARVDGLLERYFGAPSTEYSRGVSRMLLLSAVARAMRPGCKVDTMVILEGAQGAYKSSALRILAGDAWFSDSKLPIGDKDAYQQLSGVWLYELGELEALKGRSAELVKAFVSASTDKYRASYGRSIEAYERSVVFVGTTNDPDGYLADQTGNRRFWPVRVARIDLDALRRDRDQLWAEAKARFDAGEPWWPDAELASRGAHEQEARVIGDPWDDAIERWLAAQERLNPGAGVTMLDVLRHACGLPLERTDKRAEQRASTILRQLGWARGPRVREDGERVRRWRRESVPSAAHEEGGPGGGAGGGAGPGPAGSPVDSALVPSDHHDLHIRAHARTHARTHAGSGSCSRLGTAGDSGVASGATVEHDSGFQPGPGSAPAPVPTGRDPVPTPCRCDLDDPDERAAIVGEGVPS
jgi:putative DNA primase/helicase